MNNSTVAKNTTIAEKGEIVLYSPNELTEHIEVRVGEETVWLNQAQMVMLFGREQSVISKHIRNIFKEGELDEKVVYAKFAYTTQHGAIKGKTQTKFVDYYNLDVIISVGYRVKSKQGTQFRIWANKILKDYLLKGYSINNRMNRIEDKFDALSNKVNEIDLQINTHLVPTQGIFFNGQIFDAYIFVNKIIKSATKSIVLIDNYIDETVLTIFSEKPENVKVVLLTNDIKEKLKLSVEKFNEQYKNIEAKKFSICHDRFLIIDNKEIYHLGASLKDFGKKIFAFSKMESDGFALLEKIDTV
jgi:hypothetical protein